MKLIKQPVEYDEGLHRYSRGGRWMPSVTQILAVARYTDLTFVTQNALERGTRVHNFLAQFDRGKLTAANANTEMAGYLGGWIEFKHDHKFVPAVIETPCSHPLYGYGGTPDRFGRWSRKKRWTVLEIKSGSAPDSTGVQLAAYSLLFTKPNPDRIAVVLPGDGTYKLKLYQGPKDLNHFMAALTVFDYHVQHGRIEREFRDAGNY